MVSGLKNNSRKKNKLVFAKDKNQAIAAIVVFSLFILNGIYMMIKSYNENHPKVTTAAVSTNQSGIESGKMAGPSTDPLGEITAPAPGAVAQDANDIYSQTMELKNEKMKTVQVDTHAPAASSGDDVEIMARTSAKGPLAKRKGKMVTVAISDAGRSNPFVPAIENVSQTSSLPLLTAPPETLSTNTDASKVMTTTISGILYDQYSPSAIINIEGTDYLVKRGDVINHYKILSISKTQVLVQLGRNIYKAGVGELLSQTDLNYNTIANLNKKFGGNHVSINVKRK